MALVKQLTLCRSELNNLAQGESTLFAGTGSQLGSNSRWGDYEAVAFEGWGSNNILFATEYAAPGGQGWATHLDRVAYKSPAQR